VAEITLLATGAEHSLSYKSLASPLPVSGYTATIEVTGMVDGWSVITRSGSDRHDCACYRATPRPASTSRAANQRDSASSAAPLT